jgi:hypothetical protein
MSEGPLAKGHKELGKRRDTPPNKGKSEAPGQRSGGSASAVRLQQLQRVTGNRAVTTALQRQAPATAASSRAGESIRGMDELDAKFDEIADAFGDILQARISEVDRLATEVEKPITHEPDLIEEIMLAAVHAAVSNVTGAIAEKIAAKLLLIIETEGIENELEKTLASSFNKAVTSGMEEGISKGAAKGYAAVQHARSKEKSVSGSMFIEMHKKALIDDNRNTRNNFRKQLPRYRALERRTPGAGLDALDRMKKAVDAEYEELHGDEPQFKRSLSAWMNYLAAAALGTYKPTTIGESPGAALGSEQVFFRGATPGILWIDVIFFAPEPAKPVQVTQVTVAGLQEKLREELQHRSIASLGVSVVVHSVFGWDPWEIGRNEGGTVFFHAPPYDRSRFIKYLSAKAGRGDQPSEEAAFAGARLIIEREVGPHEIRKAMPPDEAVWSRIPPEMTSWPPK